MNVSSAIVLTKDDDNQDVIANLKRIEGCEVPIYEGHKLIVAIEAEDVSAETGIIRKIENTPGVISAQIIYAYSEHELENEMKKVEQAADYPEWLNNDTEARDIPYSGKLKI